LVVSVAALCFEDCAERAEAEPHEWGRGGIGNTMFIGLDVHKATIQVALAQADGGREDRQRGAIPNRADDVSKLAQKLGGDGCQLQFCDEAGPRRYGLHRPLGEPGVNAAGAKGPWEQDAR